MNNYYSSCLNGGGGIDSGYYFDDSDFYIQISSQAAATPPLSGRSTASSRRPYFYHHHHLYQPHHHHHQNHHHQNQNEQQASQKSVSYLLANCGFSKIMKVLITLGIIITVTISVVCLSPNSHSGQNPLSLTHKMSTLPYGAATASVLAAAPAVFSVPAAALATASVPAAAPAASSVPAAASALAAAVLNSPLTADIKPVGLAAAAAAAALTAKDSKFESRRGSPSMAASVGDTAVTEAGTVAKAGTVGTVGTGTEVSAGTVNAIKLLPYRTRLLSSDDDTDDYSDNDDDEDDRDEEAADYSRDDSSVSPNPEYFSEFTLRNVDGELQKLVDDELCHSATGSRRRRRSSSRNDDEVSSPRSAIGTEGGAGAEGCLSAPYLYVTFHGGSSDKRVKNVCKYTRDGCSLGSVLMPNRIYSPHSLRGMAEINKDELIVSESYNPESKLVRFSKCNPTLGNRREFVNVFVQGSADGGDDGNGLVHPYGFAKYKDDNHLYVSAQGTYSVLRYDLETGEPGPIAPALLNLTNSLSPEELEEDFHSDEPTEVDAKRRRHGKRDLRRFRLSRSNHKLENIFNGTFIDLGNNEIRGISFDSKGRLYVADKREGVVVYDREGYLVGSVTEEVPSPISTYYCKERESIWVGSAKHHSLHEYDANSWKQKQVVKHKDLKHPAGLVTYGEFLYVVSQDTDKLLKFSMTTGKLVRVVLSFLPDAGERIILSSC